MREAVGQCGGHLRIAEDARPLTKGEVGCDDDRGAPVEFADQVEQKLAAGLGEGQIAQLVQDQEVGAGDQISGSSLPFCTGFGVELVHQIDAIEEPPATAVCQSRRKKGPFAGVKVGQLRCRALLGVLPIKLTRDKAHVGQRPTSIKFRPGSGSGVSALF